MESARERRERDRERVGAWVCECVCVFVKKSEKLRRGKVVIGISTH